MDERPSFTLKGEAQPAAGKAGAYQPQRPPGERRPLGAWRRPERTGRRHGHRPGRAVRTVRHLEGGDVDRDFSFLQDEQAVRAFRVQVVKACTQAFHDFLLDVLEVAFLPAKGRPGSGPPEGNQNARKYGPQKLDDDFQKVHDAIVKAMGGKLSCPDDTTLKYLKQGTKKDPELLVEREHQFVNWVIASAEWYQEGAKDPPGPPKQPKWMEGHKRPGGGLLFLIGFPDFDTRDKELTKLGDALKQADSAQANNPGSYNEAEVIARLRHPHIVQVHEYGEAGGRPYFAMEFLEGGTLAGRLDGKPLPPREAAELVRTLAGAMDYAHRQGVVHRDLNPRNVVLTADGTPKITDFGLARCLGNPASLIQSGAIVGTPAYMAPEQAAGRSRDVGPAADVYALGAVLYEALTGRPPFLAATTLDTLHQVLTQEPVPPRQLNPVIDRDLETVCLQCLRKEPARRYAGAADLACFLDGKPVHARPVSRTERAWRWCRRNPALAGAEALASAAVLAVLGLLVGLAFYQAEVTHEFQDKQTALAGALDQKDEAARRAEANFRDSRRQWAMLALNHGLSRCEDGDTARGLLFLVGSLEYATEAEDADLQRFVRTSLAGWRRQLVPLQAVLSHFGPAGLAGVSPDGRTVATMTDDVRTVQLWEAEGGRPLVLLRHKGQVQCLTFSPDGRSLLTGSDRVAQFWDARTGRAQGSPLHHEEELLTALFSPDGKSFLTATKHEVRAWDRDGARPRAEVRLPDGELRALAFGPGGRTVITYRQNGQKALEARLWDAATGIPQAEPLVCAGNVTTAALHPDGRTLLTAAWNKLETETTLQLWSLVTGQPAGPPQRQPSRANGLVFSPDGKSVLVLGDRTASRWRVGAAEGGPQPASLELAVASAFAHQGKIGAAAFSPDGRVLVTGGHDGVAQVWDAATGRRLAESLEHQGVVNAVAFGGDGRGLLTVSADGNARLWRLGLGGPTDWPLRRPPATAVAGTAAGPSPGVVPPLVPDETAAERPLRPVFSPGARYLVRVAPHEETAAEVFEVATGKPLGTSLTHAVRIDVLAFSPDGRLVATGAVDGTVQVWEAESGRRVGPGVRQAGPVHAAEFGPDGKTLFAGSGADEKAGQARLWEVGAGLPRSAALAHGSKVTCVALSPDGRLGLTGTWDGKAQLWDLATGQPVGPALEHENNSSLRAVGFGRDGRTACTVTENGMVRLWRVPAGELVGQPIRPRGTLHDVALSPDGTLVATASGNPRQSLGEVRLWEAATGRPAGLPLAHEDVVRAVEFSPDGKSLLTGSADGTARLWDVVTGLPVGPRLLSRSARLLPEPLPPLDTEPDEERGIAAVAFAADGRTVALAGADDLSLGTAPAPLGGTPEQLGLWAQTVGGLQLDAGGGAQVLLPRDWLNRWDRLRAQGGVGDGERTLTAPLVERRKRLRDLQPKLPFGAGLGGEAFATGG